MLIIGQIRLNRDASGLARWSVDIVYDGGGRMLAFRGMRCRPRHNSGCQGQGGTPRSDCGQFPSVGISLPRAGPHGLAREVNGPAQNLCGLKPARFASLDSPYSAIPGRFWPCAARIRK